MKEKKRKSEIEREKTKRDRQEEEKGSKLAKEMTMLIEIENQWPIMTY